MSLSSVVKVNPDNCVNCHSCISVCPSKYCNDGSLDHVEINPDLCIGCGECIRACTHDARYAVDDCREFIKDLESGVPMVVIAAPGIAAEFPDTYLNLNGWLRQKGVKAVFDVSFGAELTVKSYLEHLKANPGKTIIAQPCPAIVTYIEIHRPELLDYLAPAHSPMLHTVCMIREFYPEYKNCRIGVLSPCIAKKREFIEQGLGDYNVTFKNLRDYFVQKGISLRTFRPVEYEGVSPERAVEFSSPGGLLSTAERWVPGISKISRKIEGPTNIYHYLDGLDKSIALGKAPALIDCLNCENGCNGGTGTSNIKSSPDILESNIRKRSEKTKNKHKKIGPASQIRTKKSLEKIINKYWKPKIYDCTYKDRSSDSTLDKPSQADLNKIYRDMLKKDKRDMLNCPSCGYNSCEGMALAVKNNLNKPENCHLFREKRMDQYKREIEEVNLIKRLTNNIFKLSDSFKGLIEGFKDMNADFEVLNVSSRDLKKMVKSIDNITLQTRLLSFNTAIEAARAGEKGLGFSVVAEQVRRLAEDSKKEADKINPVAEMVNEVSLGLKNRISEFHETVDEMDGLLKNLKKALDDNDKFHARECEG